MLLFCPSLYFFKTLQRVVACWLLRGACTFFFFADLGRVFVVVGLPQGAPNSGWIWNSNFKAFLSQGLTSFCWEIMGDSRTSRLGSLMSVVVDFQKIDSDTVTFFCQTGVFLFMLAIKNLSQASKPFFAGAATPATHPALYTASVAAAFDTYCEMVKDSAMPAPLMVNSHGWVTGHELGVPNRCVPQHFCTPKIEAT